MINQVNSFVDVCGFFLDGCTDIMYNVDQQLFDYCTAKFADNTQCCTPVFDIRHELPLCMEHAMKAVSDPKPKKCLRIIIQVTA